MNEDNDESAIAKFEDLATRLFSIANNPDARPINRSMPVSDNRLAGEKR